VPGIVTGHPDNGVIADDPSGVFVARIFLTHVHAITAGFNRQIRGIVHEERDVTGLGEGAKDFGRTQNVIGAAVFEAKLHAGHIAGVQRGGQMIGERRHIRQARRGDQIKSAGVIVHGLSIGFAGGFCKRFSPARLTRSPV
jgi:hypothetical protein